MPNRARQKGDRFERKLVCDLIDAGIPARRVPLSGADANHPGDVEITAWDPPILVQCKHFKRGFDRLAALSLVDRWTIVHDLKKNDAFVLTLLSSFIDWCGNPSPLPVGIEIKPAPLTAARSFMKYEDVLVVKRDRTPAFMLLKPDKLRRMIDEPRVRI